jgi:hypothetical protein
MNPKLELRFLRSEPSKIWLVASNESFAGAAEQYINENEVEALRAGLTNFPKSINDEATLEAGKNESAYGYCKLRFYCFDSVGHTAVQVSLANEIAGNEMSDNRNFASFKIQFETSELDIFVASLSKALEVGEGIATLKGIRRYTENVSR